MGSIKEPKEMMDASELHLGNCVADGDTEDDWWYSYHHIIKILPKRDGWSDACADMVW